MEIIKIKEIRQAGNIFLYREENEEELKGLENILNLKKDKEKMTKVLFLYII